MTLRIFISMTALIIIVSACTPQVESPPTAWTTVQRHLRASYRLAGLMALGHIKASPQPVVAAAQLLPTIKLLQRGGERKEAIYLAQLAINTFPQDLRYRLALIQLYRSRLGNSCSPKRTLRKTLGEYNHARRWASAWQRAQINFEMFELEQKCHSIL